MSLNLRVRRATQAREAPAACGPESPGRGLAYPHCAQCSGARPARSLGCAGFPDQMICPNHGRHSGRVAERTEQGSRCSGAGHELAERQFAQICACCDTIQYLGRAFWTKYSFRGPFWEPRPHLRSSGRTALWQCPRCGSGMGSTSVIAQRAGRGLHHHRWLHKVESHASQIQHHEPKVEHPSHHWGSNSAAWPP